MIRMPDIDSITNYLITNGLHCIMEFVIKYF